MAWVVAVLGAWVLISPFVFGVTGTYQLSLIVTGLVVGILAAYRGMMPDEKVPLPFLPLAVVIFGFWSIASPFVLGDGFGSILGITLVISGLVFIAVPAVMINRMINEQTGSEAAG